MNQIHIWYAFCREQERQEQLNMANMLVVAMRGDEKDIKGLYDFLKG